MDTSSQRLGNILMYIGSILHIIFLFEMSTVPWIVSLQLGTSVSLLIAGSIMSCGFEKIDYSFLNVLGLNMFLIGVAYEIKNYWTNICYTSCVFGGFLMIGGSILRFLKRKPAEYVITSHSFAGYLLIACGCAKLMVDSILETWTIQSFMLPEWWDEWVASIDTSWIDNALISIVWIAIAWVGNAWIDIYLGGFHMLNSIILKYIAKKKTEKSRVGK